MLLLQKQRFTPSLFQKSRRYFQERGDEITLQKSPHSMCARFVVAQCLEKMGIFHWYPHNVSYQVQNYFYSISHSHDYLFVALASRKVAVDVEQVLFTRNESLLDNFLCSSEGKWFQSQHFFSFSPWQSFYLSWCAKEVLVKGLSLPFSEVEYCRIVALTGSYVRVQYQGISYLLSFRFQDGYCRVRGDHF